MFDFFIPVAIFGFGGYFLYKLFELYGMRNERKTIIDRLDANGLIEYIKRMPIGVGGGNLKPESNTPKKNTPAMWTLRCSLCIIGVGLGLICGYLIATNNEISDTLYRVRDQYEAILFASVCVCAGLGLLLSFIIETIIAKMSKE